MKKGLSTFARVKPMTFNWAEYFGARGYSAHVTRAFVGNFKPLTMKQWRNIYVTFLDTAI
jgi:hypothetical protein